MAHDPRTKARAQTMLLTGESTRYVAGQTGLPRTTIRRWQREAFALARASLSADTRQELAEIGRAVAVMFPGLRKLRKNGPKKESREDYR